MKKIVDSRKLLGVTKVATLDELKKVYRNMMKDCHPDKFHDDEIGKAKAEETSKSIIDAYHFLVSIAPETVVLGAEEYAATTASAMADYEYKGQTLKIIFVNGSSYEYFDVPRNTYIKLVNSDSQTRFARRHIYNEFVFRKVTKLTTV